MSIVDFHNHLIPGVDDGAQTLEDARAGAAAFVADGVTAFVATPHFEGGLTLNAELRDERLAQLDAAWAQLQALCRQEFSDLEVYRAVELLLDVPEPDLSDPRLRIAGGRFFLVEFPFMTVPPQSSRVIQALSSGAFAPVIAHPERYHGLVTIDIAGEWKDAGALLQVNGGSLLGRYGAQPRRFAFELLQRGWVDFICSDYHGRGEPLVRQYQEALVRAGGAEQAHTLLRTNPARLLRGEAPLPVAPLRAERKSMWQRVSAIFR